MKIPVFVSCPSDLNVSQEGSRRLILRELDKISLEARTIGRSDYPTELPLREVCTLARHCAGGVILGFEQFRANGGICKAGTGNEKVVTTGVPLPTPWNHVEAGILFALGLPLLVFKESGIAGGVFDHGVTDVFVHKMPLASKSAGEKKGLSAVLLKWQASVRTRYYSRRAICEC